MGELHLQHDNNSAVRILALVPITMQGKIRRQLAPLCLTIDFISRAAEVSHLALSQTSYHVALLPAALPDNGWWSLWGQMALLTPQPEILVYAPTASFKLWSGVLEVGGYDVIVEPFTDEELRRAVNRAASSFAERLSNEHVNE